MLGYSWEARAGHFLFFRHQQLASLQNSNKCYHDQQTPTAKHQQENLRQTSFFIFLSITTAMVYLALIILTLLHVLILLLTPPIWKHISCICFLTKDLWYAIARRSTASILNAHTHTHTCARAGRFKPQVMLPLKSATKCGEQMMRYFYDGN